MNGTKLIVTAEKKYWERRWGRFTTSFQSNLPSTPTRFLHVTKGRDKTKKWWKESNNIFSFFYLHFHSFIIIQFPPSYSLHSFCAFPSLYLRKKTKLRPWKLWKDERIKFCHSLPSTFIPSSLSHFQLHALNINSSCTYSSRYFGKKTKLRP